MTFIRAVLACLIALLALPIYSVAAVLLVLAALVEGGTESASDTWTDLMGPM